MEWLWDLLLLDHIAGDGGTVLWPPRFPRLVEPWQKLLFLAALGGAFAVAWWLYRNEPDYVAAKRKRVLIGLRMGGVLVLLFALTGAFLEVQRREAGRRAVLLLVDRSSSMAISDRIAAEPQAAGLAAQAGIEPAALDAMPRAELARRVLARADGPIAKLMDGAQVEAFAFGQEAQIAAVEIGSPEAPLANIPAPTDNATRLGDAMRDAARRLKGRRVDAVVVITDGGSNRGDDPVEAARELGSPVFAIGVGAPQHKDLAVTFLFAEDVVFKGDTFPVSVRIRQRGYTGQSARLIIRRDDEIVKEDQVELDDQVERVKEIDVAADKIGTFSYSAEIEPMADESIVDNNKKTKAGIRVVDKKIRVLVVDDAPRWETRYLASVLDADRARIAPTFIMRQADERLLQQGETRWRKDFPDSAEELRAFDVVVLGNMPADFFADADLKALEGFVREDGGGLLLIAGRNHMPDGYQDTRLADLIPVEFTVQDQVAPDDELASTIKDSFRPKLTSEGRKSALMRLVPDAAENDLTWGRAQPMHWFHRATAVKPGATALLAHPDGGSDGDGAPILVQSRYGKGQVLYVATDEMWRLRFRPGPQHHRRLWGQAIGSLSMAHLLGKTNRIQLEAERGEYALGERATIIARVLDKDFTKLVVDSVQASARRGEIDAKPFALDAVPDQPGVYRGEFAPDVEGTYRIAISGEEDEAELILAVVDPKIELDDPGMRQELLERITSAGGGAFMPLHEADALPAMIAERRSEAPVKREERALWNAPGIVVLFALLFGLEWFLRKRSDLL
ncbi:MAG TPA: hypothetical protein VEL07_15455 [Planctomycetota bacterium]|nr:hypothetical protein [Planctomycetota bacterium]